jgi:hypothetical protein
MNTKNSLLRAAVLSFGVIAFLTFLHACSFTPGQVELCSLIEGLPLTPVAGQPASPVFEDPGTIKVMHGSGCAHIDNQPQLKVEQSVDIPSYANKAAVFLNGWKLKYSGGDHHVMGMATVLGKINVQRGKVTWQAYGALADDGSDKSIDWCYYYTVIAWNDVNLHAFVDQGDANSFCKSGEPSGYDNFFYASNTGTSTALSSFTSFLSNANFASGRTVALLPRGFGVDWAPDDHHLLQVAYNLGHGETFIQDQPYKKAEGELHPLPTPPTGRVGSGFVSWNTSAIFKDNDTRRDYSFGEFVSGMGGPDVDVVEPPFSILPYDGPGWFSACLHDAFQGIQKKDVVIDNVPYAYAVPMLTGWELWYGCAGDQHVREIGTWIDNLHYDRLSNASTGTLRYTVFSTLHDDSSNWGYYQAKVTILGLRPLVGRAPVK